MRGRLFRVGGGLLLAMSGGPLGCRPRATTGSGPPPVASSSPSTSASPRASAAPSSSVAPARVADGGSEVPAGDGGAETAARIDGGLARDGGADGGLASGCRVLEGPVPAPEAPARAAWADPHLFYWMGIDGAVRRRALPGEKGTEDPLVARGRPGTELSAVLLGPGRGVVAYLADGMSADGPMLQAFVAVDGHKPLRISEEGTGATYVSLARRGPQVLAVMLDGRTAMTPVHVRVLSPATEGPHAEGLAPGPDAVIFVGGPAPRRPRGALVTMSRVAEPGGSTAFALLPMEQDARGFGMAIVRVDDPPRDDEPATWSLYPNGLEPAAVAGTHNGTSMYFARVRPETPSPGATRVLELGRLSGIGEPTLLGVVARAGRLDGVRLVGDDSAGGATPEGLTLDYVADGSALRQRLLCPP